MMARRLVAEGLGTALLLAVVVGSGIMGERLSDGNAAIALLANAMATGAGLVALITIFGPISGAHFNPAVTAVFALRGETTWRDALPYALVQIGGAVIGVWCAHLMFGESVIQISTHARAGLAQWFSEGVATFGLITVIIGGLRAKPESVPWLVGLYITATYWFTASTSFANPAVTVARALTDSFAGIAPGSVPGFIAGQLAGALAAFFLCGWLFRQERAS